MPAAPVADRESLLLSSAGAVGGLAIALVDTPAAGSSQPRALALDLAIDVRVLAFTTLVAVMTSLAFGLAPALTASRVDLAGALKGSAGEGRGHSRLRSGFLVAQVSMSVLLLIAAGLFIRGFRNARSFDLGFDTDRVLTASVELETRGYSEARGREFVRAIVERLGAAPGVVGANALDIVPVTLSNRTGQMIREGDPEPGPDRPPLPNVYLNAVGPGTSHPGLPWPLVAISPNGTTRLQQSRSSTTRLRTRGRNRAPWASGCGRQAHRRPLEVVGVVATVYVTVDEEPRPLVYRPSRSIPARDPSGRAPNVRRRTTDDQGSRESAGSGLAIFTSRRWPTRLPGMLPAQGRQTCSALWAFWRSSRRAGIWSALISSGPHARIGADRDRRDASGCCLWWSGNAEVGVVGLSIGLISAGC